LPFIKLPSPFNLKTAMDKVHLLVLVHGMWGNPMHLAELARAAREAHADPSLDGTSLQVLVAETVRGDSTFDGIDWGGERVAAEVFLCISIVNMNLPAIQVMETVNGLKAEGKRVVRFSITGYSLGGLISRYCIG